MANRYTDDDDRLRCCTCDGYVVAGKKCMKCRNRKRKGKTMLAAEEKAAEVAERKDLESKRAIAWRARALRNYTDYVLRLDGAARLEFMGDHPVSEIFQ